MGFQALALGVRRSASPPGLAVNESMWSTSRIRGPRGLVRHGAGFYPTASANMCIPWLRPVGGFAPFGGSVTALTSRPGMIGTLA